MADWPRPTDAWGSLRHGLTLKAASGAPAGSGEPNANPNANPNATPTLPLTRFLGTESYPEEGAFKAFLQKHGGSSNAFTGMETTGFHFVLQATTTGVGVRDHQRSLRPLVRGH